MPKRRASNYYTFISGFVQDRNLIRVIGQVDQLNDAGEPNSILRKWIRNEKHWYEFDLDWYATRILALTEPQLEVYAVGPTGRVNVGTTRGDQAELILGQNQVSGQYGEIRDARI